MRRLALTALLILSALALRPAPMAAAPEGTMTWGLHVTLAARWLDPAETEAFINPFMVLYAVHDALVKPMPGGDNTPSLAESWTQSKDGLVYEFILRKNAKFHNGDPVTAEDVKFSFDRYKGAAAKLLHDRVREVQIVDPGRVRFHLKEPWGDRPTWPVVPHLRHGGRVMTANDPARHYPGQYFSCDARSSDGDRRLCPMHEQAPTALRRILAMLDEDVTPAELADEIRIIAMRALGAGPT